jgi:predicted GNAT family acetyltransferase
MQKLEDGTYCVISTFVDPAHRDSGIGWKLYEALIDFIRTEGTKFKTTCPYISQIMSEDKDNKDIYLS